MFDRLNRRVAVAFAMLVLGSTIALIACTGDRFPTAVPPSDLLPAHMLADQLQCGTAETNVFYARCMALNATLQALLHSGEPECEEAGWWGYQTPVYGYQNVDLAGVNPLTGETGLAGGQTEAYWNSSTNSFFGSTTETWLFPVSSSDDWADPNAVAHETVHVKQAATMDSAAFADTSAAGVYAKEAPAYAVGELCKDVAGGPVLFRAPEGSSNLRSRHTEGTSMIAAALLLLAAQQSDTLLTPSAIRVVVAAVYSENLRVRAQARASSNPQKASASSFSDEPVFVDVESFKKLSGRSADVTLDWSPVTSALGSNGTAAATSRCKKEGVENGGCPWITATGVKHEGDHLIVAVQFGWRLAASGYSQGGMISRYEVEIAPDHGIYVVKHLIFKGANAVTFKPGQ